jgi:hypothetical protein
LVPGRGGGTVHAGKVVAGRRRRVTHWRVKRAGLFSANAFGPSAASFVASGRFMVTMAVAPSRL